jgi:hypothetical protein
MIKDSMMGSRWEFQTALPARVIITSWTLEHHFHIPTENLPKKMQTTRGFLLDCGPGWWYCIG